MAGGAEISTIAAPAAITRLAAWGIIDVMMYEGGDRVEHAEADDVGQ
ncbi:hypothetical protein [Phyllobacterium leguminum]|uniref:Uncharacterized protein n=1 Tax=Phyllobacterium leguminum TaxID=314237 RepID=A0A318STG8_9HYPH|nr:hypothetical protein [Phyllobacterium leguminum]PYE85140.1 hypothetical protein C7477_14110 [Phyllobacterium leguminum]